MLRKIASRASGDEDNPMSEQGLMIEVDRDGWGTAHVTLGNAGNGSDRNRNLAEEVRRDERAIVQRHAEEPTRKPNQEGRRGEPDAEELPTHPVGWRLVVASVKHSEPQSGCSGPKSGNPDRWEDKLPPHGC